MATYPDDASLSGKKPDRNIPIKKKYKTSIFTSESGYEKRQLKSRRPKRELSLTYTRISETIKSNIETFYDNRSGEFESFYFDLAHINQSGIIRVRFDGDLDIEELHSKGADDNIYTLKFNLKEVYD